MFYAPWYWQRDLLTKAASLRQQVRAGREAEGRFSRLEQSVMLGFYAIRKAIETDPHGEVLGRQQFSVVAYRATGETVTHLNWHRFQELYDLQRPVVVRRDLLFLCDQFIQSYVCMLRLDAWGEPIGIRVSSNHERHRYLYDLTLEAIMHLFERVGGCDAELHPWHRRIAIRGTAGAGDCGTA